tara:strand:- start:150 stop:452 length:303 start_codon:yes stop_codon:yes gene_type:complete
MSQKEISELNEVLSLNSPLITVTKVVHKFTFPLAICPAIVELSTTVYVVPFITAVSPTLALAQLHVPLLSKEIEDDAVLDEIIIAPVTVCPEVDPETVRL